jgi:glycosyltransferase involved in cell wall biosynthesis
VKLIIQIPCLNEEITLPQTLADLPRQIEGIAEIEFLVIDDGSTDTTVQVARANGVHHIVSHPQNRGLAAAFKTGLEACLLHGADIIVNTDADNQYPGAAIPALVAPILRGEADMVIGDRRTQQIAHFSRSKKLLQWLGSAVVRWVSGTDIPDAPSGFRAFSRDAAMRLNVVTNYSYTLESIIQAGKKNMAIASVPVTTNPETRPSRLFKSNLSYIRYSAGTILRLFLLFDPFRSFLYLSLPFFFVGMATWVRYLVLILQGSDARGANIQSIQFGSVLIITSILMVMFGLIGEILAVNRRIQEDSLYYIKQLRFKKND